MIAVVIDCLLIPLIILYHHQVCELVAAFCSQSDHLRIQLEAEWQDICWWGSQVRHTKTVAGGAYGRGELKPIGTVIVRNKNNDNMTTKPTKEGICFNCMESYVGKTLRNG
jgi:hypothetical protein